MTEHDDLIQRLHSMGTQPIDGSRQSTDLTAMAGVRAPRVGSKLRLAGAFLAGLLIGSTGLAAADALPDPAQHAAHTVLSQVGVQVPDPERYHGPECGAEVKKNHGAYVKDNHALAKSGCGKKVGAGGKDGTTDAKADKGPCRGKPPWAGDKTSTDEEKAAAEAERDAQCPDEADEADGVETPETEAPDADDPTIEAPAKGSTTTTEAPTTTTTVAETTTTTV